MLSILSMLSTSKSKSQKETLIWKDIAKRREREKERIITRKSRRKAMRISDSSRADCFVFIFVLRHMWHSLICNQLVSQTLPIVKLCVIATGCQSSWNWNRISYRIELSRIKSVLTLLCTCQPVCSTIKVNNQSDKGTGRKWNKAGRETEKKSENKGNYWHYNKWNQEKVIACIKNEEEVE